MFKTITPFYIVCLVLYIFFSRRPDYLEGEFTNGIVHYIKDSTQKPVVKAIFSVNKLQDTVDAAYPFRHLKEGETVKIIYETSEPLQAAVYSWWGYWLQWDELLASFFIPFILLLAAKVITAGPTPEALVEELEMQNPVKRRKYD